MHNQDDLLFYHENESYKSIELLFSNYIEKFFLMDAI